MSNDVRNARTAAAILDAAAHALAEHGRSANMAEFAAAAGVSRATLYRYYPDREALLEALAAHALADAAARLSDAGLERAPVDEAIERIVRSLAAVGDRYAVLLGEIEADPAEIERLIAAPMRARALAARRLRRGAARALRRRNHRVAEADPEGPARRRGSERGRRLGLPGRRPRSLTVSVRPRPAREPAWR
jgi:AcrR family transcriptional regulator